MDFITTSTRRRVVVSQEFRSLPGDAPDGSNQTAPVLLSAASVLFSGVFCHSQIYKTEQLLRLLFG